MYSYQSEKAGDGVMCGADENSDQARLELQADGLAAVDLSARDSATFAIALLDPKPVSARLQDTARRYRELMDIEKRNV